MEATIRYWFLCDFLRDKCAANIIKEMILTDGEFLKEQYEKRYKYRVNWTNFIAFFIELNTVDSDVYKCSNKLVNALILIQIFNNSGFQITLEVLSDARIILFKKFSNINSIIDELAFLSTNCSHHFLSYYHKQKWDRLNKYLNYTLPFLCFQFLSWSPKLHYLFPSETQQQIKTILLLSLFNPKTKQPQHSNCYFYKLPREIRFEIFKLLYK